MRQAGKAGAMPTSAAMHLPASATDQLAAPRSIRAIQSTSTSALGRKLRPVAEAVAVQPVRTSMTIAAAPAAVALVLRQAWAVSLMAAARLPQQAR
jgi:hypothetical protein